MTNRRSVAFDRLAIASGAYLVARALAAWLLDPQRASATQGAAAGLLVAISLVLLSGSVRKGAGGARSRIAYLVGFAIAVCYVNPLLEVFFFHLPGLRNHSIGASMLGFLALLGYTLCVALFVDGPAAPASRRLSAIGLTWRLAAGAMTYIVSYFVAGAIALPYVHWFYAGVQLPSMGTLLALQLVRGLIFSGVSATLLVNMRSGKLSAGLVIGFALAVMGGISLLLGPNSVLPAEVRLVHAIEIGTSHFLFGIVLASLFAPPRGSSRDSDDRAGGADNG